MGENEELTYMSADEYINSPMMYIDETYGEAADTWACATDDAGFFNFMTTRYVKGDKYCVLNQQKQ